MATKKKQEIVIKCTGEEHFLKYAAPDYNKIVSNY
jgi:hypothetical protein